MGCKSSMRKKVLIVSEYELNSFSGAAFERLRCYAKALPGIDFICLNPFTGFLAKPIPYSDPGNLYFIPGDKKAESFLYRNFFKFFDFNTPLKLYSYIKGTFRKDEVTVLLYSSWLPLFFYVINGLHKRRGYKVVVEKNELETGIIKNISSPDGIARFVFMAMYPYRFFSAWLIDWLTRSSPVVISISTKIHAKYHPYTLSLTVPILVDSDRFARKNNKQDEELRFVYLGAISENKDGLFELVKILNDHKLKNDNFIVDIIGSGNKRVTEKLKASITENGLNGLIKIKDPVTSQQVPAVLQTYDYALLLRPSNTQTEYGFSTKLGEYLAAGLPVLYTHVGDNERFLENGEHGFLIPFPLLENAPGVFSKALKTRGEHLHRMSDNAVKLVEDKFDYRIYQEQLKQAFN